MLTEIVIAVLAISGIGLFAWPTIKQLLQDRREERETKAVLNDWEIPTKILKPSHSPECCDNPTHEDCPVNDTKTYANTVLDEDSAFRALKQLEKFFTDRENAKGAELTRQAGRCLFDVAGERATESLSNAVQNAATPAVATNAAAAAGAAAAKASS